MSYRGPSVAVMKPVCGAVLSFVVLKGLKLASGAGFIGHSRGFLGRSGRVMLRLEKLAV